MMDNDSLWKYTFKLLWRFMSYSNFHHDEMMNVCNLIKEYYDKNKKHMENVMKEIEVEE